jgi:hypothetical protein
LIRGNETVHEVIVYPLTDPGEDTSGTYHYAIWDRIAEGIGNLQELSDITIVDSHCMHPLLGMDEDETKALIAVLKRNYRLEEIPGFHHGAGDIRSIFELNRAGRRYLVQDGSSISKGVDALSGVSNDINYVFLHLLIIIISIYLLATIS